MSIMRKAVAGMALAATVGSGAAVALSTPAFAKSWDSDKQCYTIIVEKGTFHDSVFAKMSRNCMNGENAGATTTLEF